MFVRSVRSSWWLFVPGTLAITWMIFMDYSGLNGQDAHDYYRIARAWTAWWSGGVRPVMMEHPHGYPFLGALIGLLIGVLPGLRLLSLVGFFATALILHRLVRVSDRRSATRYVLLGFCLSPFVLRYAMTTLSDVTAIAWVMAAFMGLVAWCTDRKITALAGMLLCLACALSVRFAVMPIALMMVALAIEAAARVEIGWRPLAFITMLGGALLAWALHVVPRADLLQGSPLAEWTPLNWFHRVHRSDDGELHYKLPNIIHALGVFLHPGQFPLGLLLVPFFRWADLGSPRGRRTFILAVCYLLFVAGMPFQNDRVLLMAQPLIVLLFHPAFTRGMAWLEGKGRSPWPFLVMAALVQVALFVRAMLPFVHQARVEREIATTIGRFQPDRIYTHGMGAALSTYCPTAEITELWYAELDSFRQGALVLLHPGDLADQWQGLPPAVNWERLQKQGVETVEERPDGWSLFRVR